MSRSAGAGHAPADAAHLRPDAGWSARLQLDYRAVGGRTVAMDRHEGPMRVLKALYPDGSGTCEHVLVHPPSGLVGGDAVTIEARLGPQARVRLTTPGATRFYRSLGAVASQRLSITLQEGARLEWLPMEALAYEGCRALNECRVALEPGAEMLGWDISCLGLPASGDHFRHGELKQHLEVEGAWLDKGVVRGEDLLLRQSPLGLAGHPVVGSLWCATGSAMSASRREELTAAAESAASPVRGAGLACGATSPVDRVVVVRALAPQVEPMLALFRRVRASWHAVLWGVPAAEPRLWRL